MWEIVIQQQRHGCCGGGNGNRADYKKSKCTFSHLVVFAISLNSAIRWIDAVTSRLLSYTYYIFKANAKTHFAYYNSNYATRSTACSLRMCIVYPHITASKSKKERKKMRAKKWHRTVQCTQYNSIHTYTINQSATIQLVLWSIQITNAEQSWVFSQYWVWLQIWNDISQ